MAYNLMPLAKQQFLDDNGDPLAGGKLYTYQAGTTTPLATYTNATDEVENTNPVILDAAGRATVWLDVEQSYKFILTDANENTIYTEDNVIGLLTNNAVSTEALQDQSVTREKIADDAVGADQLRDDATTDSNRAVTTNHIRNGAVTTEKLNDTCITLSKLAEAVSVFLCPTGSLAPYMGATAPTGWMLLNGSTIGNASSGATRANADTEALFTVLWNSITNTELPILDGFGVASTRGASAAADFAANKRLPIPDARNVFLRGANASSRAIGGVTYPAVTLGGVALDKFQGHIHQYTLQSEGVSGGAGAVVSDAPGSGTAGTHTLNTGGPVNDGSNGAPRSGSETAPVNMGVNYIIKL